MNGSELLGQFLQNLLDEWEGKDISGLSEDVQESFLHLLQSLREAIFKSNQLIIMKNQAEQYFEKMTTVGIKEFFENSQSRVLPKTSQIKALAESLNSDSSEDAERMLRDWMVGLIASVYGVPNRHSLIIAGAQGSGKSEFFRRLLPNDLSGFFIEIHLEECDKNNLLSGMVEMLIVLNDGMTSQSLGNWKHLKSTQQFIIRNPYNNEASRVKRLASLCATTNDKHTADRLEGSNLVIRVGEQIDFEKYNSIDKAELWLEAYQNFING